MQWLKALLIKKYVQDYLDKYTKGERNKRGCMKKTFIIRLLM